MCSFWQAAVTMETLSVNRAIIASLEKFPATSLIWNGNSDDTSTEPCGRLLLKQQLELKTLWNFTRALQSVRNQRSQQMLKVIGIPASNMKRRSFSCQTVSCALLKSSSVRTECCIGRCWNPSSKTWAMHRIWFEKTSLKVTGKVFCFSGIVEPVSNDTFQKLYDRGRKQCQKWLVEQLVRKKRRHLVISQLLVMGWWQLSRSVGNIHDRMIHWRWKAVPGELMDQLIWGTLAECCLS